eukprot:790948-Pyramimonas_sp.AAC.1
MATASPSPRPRAATLRTRAGPPRFLMFRGGWRAEAAQRWCRPARMGERWVRGAVRRKVSVCFVVGLRGPLSGCGTVENGSGVEGLGEGQLLRICQCPPSSTDLLGAHLAKTPWSGSL